MSRSRRMMESTHEAEVAAAYVARLRWKERFPSDEPLARLPDGRFDNRTAAQHHANLDWSLRDACRATGFKPRIVVRLIERGAIAGVLHGRGDEATRVASDTLLEVCLGPLDAHLALEPVPGVRGELCLHRAVPAPAAPRLRGAALSGM